MPVGERRRNGGRWQVILFHLTIFLKSIRFYKVLKSQDLNYRIDHQAPLSMEILQARTLEKVAMPFSRGSSQPRDQTQVIRTKSPEPRSPALQEDSSPSEPPEKPKNTRVGNLSLLQGIFPTQELNLGFLHCQQILPQLNYQGKP